MKIDCYKCEHYYVTWDENFPHGCRALGFKSTQLPGTVVRRTTPTIECLSFKEKIKKEKRPH